VLRISLLWMPLLISAVEADDGDATEAEQVEDKSDEEYDDGADVVGTWLEALAETDPEDDDLVDDLYFDLIGGYE
jgi:hypothetical protein